jgi:transmembrane sensor
MTAPDNKLKHLLESEKWTEEDRQWLLHYLETTDTPELKEMMLDQLHTRLAEPEGAVDARSVQDLEAIHARMGVRPERARLVSIRFRRLAAACIIGLIVIGVVYRSRTGGVDAGGVQKERLLAKKDDVAPGGNKAVLTLADGSTIALDDAQNGALTQQGSTRVLKQNGQLAYHPAGAQSKQTLYNSIATPRGGQFQVTLPDGTQVWLNAASSIRFPTAFSGSERRVTVSGEAYFEVAKNVEKPFVVQVQHSEVHVLGTHFNIMAYTEEDVMRATLLEGSIRFSSGGSSNILKPGQQSQLMPDGHVTIENNVNIEEVVAWKNGVFHFERADIESVMRQLSRWYDVEVVYQHSSLNGLFHADIPKNTNLSMALKALELTGKVHFQIEGKKVIVLP